MDYVQIVLREGPVQPKILPHTLPEVVSIDAQFMAAPIKDMIATARLRLFGQTVRAGPEALVGRWRWMNGDTGRDLRYRPETWEELVFNDILERGLTEEHCYALRHWKRVTAWLPSGPQELPTEIKGPDGNFFKRKRDDD